jgi:hypothetical protein
MNRRSILKVLPSLFLLPLLSKRVQATPLVSSVRLTTRDRHQNNMDLADLYYSIHNRVSGPSLSHQQLHFIHPLDSIPGTALVGPERRVPIRLSLGEYLAEIELPAGHDESATYIRWYLKEYPEVRCYDSVIRELTEPHLTLCNISRFKNDYNPD